MTSRGMKMENKDEDQLILNTLVEVSNAIKSCKPPDHLEYFAMFLVKHMREVREEKHLDMAIKLLQVVKEFKD